MPLRAFVLFGQTIKADGVVATYGKGFNALAGICAFWTHGFGPDDPREWQDPF